VPIEVNVWPPTHPTTFPGSFFLIDCKGRYVTGTGFGEKKKCVKKRAIKPEKEVFRGELLLVVVIRDGTRTSYCSVIKVSAREKAEPK